ncbi:SIMPL domain-containing protein [Brevundimonas naejangsanensis]|uniref:SIMPL domain-containing protein n=1 Tax=Brevundimonas naejangsanensis TaxID=588932 RepID=A0A494RJB5_9CAUL|nr:SIMPL domain-containing protein [Brevundimonas naejangsanensis]AYG94052.1 SIMPL domain-containing protein [Brevundimonas naejangsanensis]
MTRTARALMLGTTLGTALMALAAPAVASAQSQPGGASPMPMMHAMVQQPALNLSAYGEVKVAPDQATINFGVVTEAATAQAAMAQNAQQMTRVVAALRRAGIAERDIQTSGLNLSAQYDYQQNEPPKLRGYQASNRVTVTINDLAKVGTTADAVVAAGVNQIDGIGFGLKDPKAAEDQARLLAVRALQDKARLYAQALGVQLGQVRSLTEGGGYAPEPPRPVAMYARVAMDSAASTPVSAGELTVRIDISGTYDIGR